MNINYISEEERNMKSSDNRDKILQSENYCECL